MSKKILVVDDDVNVLRVTKSRLESNGYDVRILSEPINVEETIEKYQPDLLLIDIVMPHRSGFDIVEEFNKRKIFVDLPKIFLTGLDDEIEKMIAKSEGINRYITKPFDPKDLIGAIEELLKEQG